MDITHGCNCPPYNWKIGAGFSCFRRGGLRWTQGEPTHPVRSCALQLFRLLAAGVIDVAQVRDQLERRSAVVELS